MADDAANAVRKTTTISNNVCYYIRPFLLFLVLNFVSYFILWTFGVERAYIFNLDYAIGLLIIICIRNYAYSALIFGTLILSIILIVDVGSRVGNIYIVNIDSIEEYVQFSRYWPWPIFGMVLFGIAIFASIVTSFAVNTPTIEKPVLAILPFLLLPIADILAGHSGVSRRDNKPMPNMMSSATRTVLDPLFMARGTGTFSVQPAPQSLALDEKMIGSMPDRTLSVAVESLGSPVDVSARSALLQPLILGLSGSYQLTVDRDHITRGGTLSGELRELCGVTVSGIPQKASAIKQIGPCLPTMLKQKGIVTFAAHGNSPSFYARSKIYPAIGFSRQYFLGNQELLGAQRCGKLVFGGVCDADMYHFVIQELSRSPKSFGHLITLDTHFPIVSLPGSCSAALTDGGVPCKYANALKSSFDSLVYAVQSSPNPPQRIIVYGDHAPPFLEDAQRARFHRYQVPFLTFDLRAKPLDPP